MAFTNSETCRRCEYCGMSEGAWVQTGYCCRADAAERTMVRVQNAARMLTELGWTVVPPNQERMAS